MDAREAAIALAGSRNAAVELIVHRIVDLGTTDLGAIGAKIAELTTQIHEAYLPQLQAALNMAAGNVTPMQQAVATVQQAMPGSTVQPVGTQPVYPRPVAAPGPAPDNWTYTGRECPVCVQNGRSGQLLQSIDASFKGPEFKCNLVKRTKQGTEWVDSGLCQYQEWGRNARS